MNVATLLAMSRVSRLLLLVAVTGFVLLQIGLVAALPLRDDQGKCVKPEKRRAWYGFFQFERCVANIVDEGTSFPMSRRKHTWMRSYV